MDKNISAMLFAWIKKNLDGAENPRATGKALTGSLDGLWRYRIGDYRIISEISDKKIISKENGIPSKHSFLKFILLTGHMLSWLHSGGVSHDVATPRHNALYSLFHNMYYGIDGSSKHRPTHWSIHEYSGIYYFFKTL
jgi:hypothetical protein